MGRRKKAGFRNQKMLSGRLELDDYIKFEETLERQYRRRVKIQEALQSFARSVISGSIQVSGSLFTGGNGP